MLFWFRAFVILNRASSCQCVPCKDRFHEHQASRRHNVVKEENAGGLSLIVVTRRVAEGVGVVAHLMLHSSIRRIMFVPKTTDELAMTHHCKTIIPSFGIVRKQSGEAHMTPSYRLKPHADCEKRQLRSHRGAPMLHLHKTSCKAL